MMTGWLVSGIVYGAYFISDLVLPRSEKTEEMTEGCATKTVVTTTTVVSESLDNAAMTVTKETVSRTVEQAASAVEAVTIGGSAGECLTSVKSSLFLHRIFQNNYVKKWSSENYNYLHH